MMSAVVERDFETNKLKLATGWKGAMYRQFWARVFTRAAMHTMFWNLVMAAWRNPDDLENLFGNFIETWKKQWEEGNLRWLDVNITPLYRSIYRIAGREPDMSAEKYFSLIGHFRDPIKFVRDPFGSAKHKGSIFSRIFLEAATGENWRGKKFTTASEWWGSDDKGVYKTTRKGKYRRGEPKGGKLRFNLTKWEFGGGGAIKYDQVPSFTMHQALNSMPVQGQQAVNFIIGEMDAFDSITKGLGLYTSSSTPKKSKKKSSGSSLSKPRIVIDASK
jgi:hypothetical protein